VGNWLNRVYALVTITIRLRHIVCACFHSTREEGKGKGRVAEGEDGKGREGGEGDRSMHPLGFLKVGAYAIWYYCYVDTTHLASWLLCPAVV